MLARAVPFLVLALATLAPLAAPGESAAPTDAARLFAEARAALIRGQAGFPRETRRTATVRVGGYEGAMSCRNRGPESLCATTLGGLSQVLYQNGARFYLHDGSGLSRELRGSLRAHERTVAMIEDGSFLAHPEWATRAAAAEVAATASPAPNATADAARYVFFQPPGGERARIGFDARGLPIEIRSPGDFGPQTIRLSDYRAVDGVMWPFAARVESPNAPPQEIALTELVSGDAGIERIAAEYPPSLRARVTRPTTVDLRTIGDHLYAPVRVGGRTYEFLVDNGAQAIVLAPRTAAALAPADGGAVSVRGSQGVAAARVLPGASLAVGDVALPAQTVLVADLGTVPDGSRNIDGILGFPFFAQTAVTLDLTRGRMTIRPARSLPPAGARCALSLDRGVPEIEADVTSGPRASFVVDTGSSDTILLYAPFARRHPGVARLGSMREKTYGIGGGLPARDARLEGIAACGLPARRNLPIHVLARAVGAFADRRLAGSVGTAYFEGATLNFDVQAGALYVEDAAP